jgi:hypothetical protein
VLLVLLNFFKMMTQFVPRLAAPGVANTSAAPWREAPQACHATQPGAAAVLRHSSWRRNHPRRALQLCLPCRSRWRRMPAAPRAMAPHLCRATLSGAAGLELKIMLKIKLKSSKSQTYWQTCSISSSIQQTKSILANMLKIKLKLKITNTRSYITNTHSYFKFEHHIIQKL